MGREIRRVPPNWVHPVHTAEDAPHPSRIGDFCSLYDEDYDTACKEWYAGIASFTPNKWSNWYHEDQGNPPDKDHYRTWSWTPEEATHFQVYETVSEGTPVTPHFEKKEELINYLVEHGDFWDQAEGKGGWIRENAESFVNNGYAPSMIVHSSAAGIVIKTPRDGA